MAEEGEYRSNPQVEQSIQNLADHLKGADVDSTRGQSFVDFMLLTRLNSKWEVQLNELKGPFPTPGTDSSERNYEESQLRIVEMRLALLTNDMDHKKTTLPGYEEELASIEQKWEDVLRSGGSSGIQSKHDALIAHITKRGMQTLRQEPQQQA
jgi:hypothetical protein